MRGYELTDFEWGVIAPLLPNKPRGVPRVDDRRVLNGIFWVLRTGRRGGRCRRILDRARPATIASSDGERLECGTAF
jgi:transposase